MDDEDDRFFAQETRPRIDLTLNIGDVLKMLVMGGAVLVWLLNAHDASSDINKRQDEKLLTHDLEISQMEKELTDIRKQQKEDMVDLYEIKYALPHPTVK